MIRDASSSDVIRVGGIFDWGELPEEGLSASLLACVSTYGREREGEGGRERGKEVRGMVRGMK
jgi:hypothetical protein